MEESRLIDLYTAAVGTPPAAVTKIIGSGSARAYYRLSGPRQLIGTIGTSRDENEAFLYLDSHFRRYGLNVPEVVAVSDDHMVYLQSDLGDTSLFKLIQRDGPDNENVRGLMRETLGRLPEMQFRAAADLDFSRCFPVTEMTRESVMWDLNYFKYCFLKLSGVDFDEAGLEIDFNRLADMIMAIENTAFMYRDFQSRNVMICGGGPWFIDFQGGRRGPALYDVASFLYQARAGFTDTLRSELAGVYLESARRFRNFTTDAFRRELWLCALFRTLQVLGAYGLRGLYERKTHFVESIPAALANLSSLSQGMETHFPALSAAIRALNDSPRLRARTPRERLVVEVNSFGFRASGIPQDMSGNGGGFVFDCRAIINPGRFPQYMPLTGLDKPVIRFLEESGEVTPFLDNAKALVGRAVRRYLERGFTSLSVSFGCTGGRHRSVYCAEQMARWLTQEMDVDVELHHRERLIDRFMPRKGDGPTPQ